MSEISLVKINSVGSKYSWLRMDQSSRVIQAQGFADQLNEITAELSGSKVVAIAGAFDVSSYSPLVPPGKNAKIINAIPYLLEDELIEEVDELHFALGKRVNQHLQVLVINKGKMQEYIEQFKDAGIKLDLLVAVDACLPELSGSVLVFINEAEAYGIIKKNQEHFYLFDLENLALVIHSLKIQLIDQPHEIILYSCGEIKKFKDAFEEQQFSILEEHQIADDLVFLANNFLDHKNPINLLQQEFSVRKTDMQLNKLLLLAAGLSAVWLAIVSLTQIISYQRYTEYQQILTKRITQEFKTAFPGQALPADPRYFINKKYHELTRGESPTNFLSLLAPVAQVLKELSGISLVEAEYNQNYLLIAVQVADFENVDKLINALKSKQLKTERQGIEQNKNGVRAKLKITSMSKA